MSEGGDAELERLKARRLAEMQRNISAKKGREEAGGAAGSEKGRDGPATARDVVVASLGFRGLEVLEGAEAQYPAETKVIVGRLAEIIRSENIPDKIDGGQLLAVFRMVGLPVKIRTSIKIEKDGKFVSISDRLKNVRSGSTVTAAAAAGEDDAN
ncbi:MAG: double-stranded DNA-binding protein [Thaumarchaeota archaeon]|nr:double-stranded DNA-binding protein [Nitrososphaerota archaeon]